MKLPESVNEKQFDKALLSNLEAVYGKKAAKRILKEIDEFKKQNPNQAFSFIFDEEGNFQAFKKE